MKRLLPLFLALAALPVLASIVVQYSTPNGEIVRVIQSADTLAYLGQSNTLINPAFPTKPITECYVTNGAITTWTPSQLATNVLRNWLAQSNDTWTATVLERSNRIYQAKNYVLSDRTEGYVIRAMLYTILNRLNALATNPAANLGTVSTNQMWLAISNSIVSDPR